MKIQKICFLFLVVAIMFIGCDTGMNVKDVGHQGSLNTYTIKFAEQISCKTSGNRSVASGDRVKAGDVLVFSVDAGVTQNLPVKWSTNPACWGVWKKDVFSDFVNSNSKSYSYTVKNSDAFYNNKDGTNVIEIDASFKSESVAIDVYSKGNGQKLKGQDLQYGLPSIFFTDSIDLKDRFEAFFGLNDLVGADKKDWLISKEYIGNDPAEVSFLNESDTVLLYFGQRTKSNKLQYELKAIYKKLAGSGNGPVVKTDTELFSFEIKTESTDKLNLVIKKAESGVNFDDSIPDSKLFLIQGNKCYTIGLDGLSNDEINGLNNEQKILDEIKKILANSMKASDIKSRGLKEAFELNLKDDYSSASSDDKIRHKKQVLKAVHDYIVDTVDYKFNVYCRSLYGALVKKEAVCLGYAIGFNKLIRELGFDKDDCAVIRDGNDGLHAWNVVNLGTTENPEWYHIDTTWDDYPESVYNGSNVNTNALKYKYFLKSTSYMEKYYHKYPDGYEYKCKNTNYDKTFDFDTDEWNVIK